MGKRTRTEKREQAEAMKLAAKTRPLQQKLARLDRGGYRAERERARLLEASRQQALKATR